VTVDLNKELAEVLRELRKNSEQHSQLLFGIAVGLSRSYISKIERMESSPTARVLFEMAEQLDMPLSEIIRKAEERAKNRVIKK
jgi:transcriptional regulator with XRE-family HTH domain